MDKISISALEKIMKGNYEAVATIDFHGQELVVRRTLPFQEMLKFVDEVVRSCFQRDTSEYIPEVKDFALLNNIVEYYSNVRLPENLDRKYELLYQTDLIPVILKAVNDRQFNEMVMAINTKIKYLADSNAEKLVREFEHVSQRFAELADKVSDLYSGVSKEDLQNIAGAIAGGSLDEEKIVQLVLDQNRLESYAASSAEDAVEEKVEE